MSDTQLAVHTPAHQFVKSGNVFGNETVNGTLSAEISGVVYDGVRFAATAADQDGLLHVATEHGELQLQTGNGDNCFAGDYRFVLEIRGNVNEFLSDERLDLIERFEFTIQYENGGSARAELAVNLIDVVYSGEHSFSESTGAQDVLPPVLAPEDALAVTLPETGGPDLQLADMGASDLQLQAADLLPGGHAAEVLELDRYFGSETAETTTGQVADAQSAGLGHAFETSRLDVLSGDDTPGLDG